MQIYNRYGSQTDAQPEIVEAFQKRNKQLEIQVAQLLDELGIPKTTYDQRMSLHAA